MPGFLPLALLLAPEEARLAEPLAAPWVVALAAFAALEARASWEHLVVVDAHNFVVDPTEAAHRP